MIYVDCAVAPGWEEGVIFASDLTRDARDSAVTLVLSPGHQEHSEEIALSGSNLHRTLRWTVPVPGQEERSILYGLHAGCEGLGGLVVVNPENTPAVLPTETQSLAALASHLVIHFDPLRLRLFGETVRGVARSSRIKNFASELAELDRSIALAKASIGETEGESFGAVRAMSDAQGLLRLWRWIDPNNVSSYFDQDSLMLILGLVGRCSGRSRGGFFAESAYWPQLISCAVGWYLRYAVSLLRINVASGAVLALNRSAELALWSLLFEASAGEISDRTGKLLLDGRENPTFKGIREKSLSVYPHVHGLAAPGDVFRSIEDLTNLRNRCVLGHGLGLISPVECNGLFATVKSATEHVLTEEGRFWADVSFRALRLSDPAAAARSSIDRLLSECLEEVV